MLKQHEINRRESDFIFCISNFFYKLLTLLWDEFCKRAAFNSTLKRRKCCSAFFELVFRCCFSPRSFRKINFWRGNSSELTTKMNRQWVDPTQAELWLNSKSCTFYNSTKLASGEPVFANYSVPKSDFSILCINRIFPISNKRRAKRAGESMSLKMVINRVNGRRDINFIEHLPRIRRVLSCQQSTK